MTSCGIGDDAALFTIPTHYELASTIDTSISGVHFPEETHACDVGYKTLAVSLSDIAAMGAKPINVLLALTLPYVDKVWLEQFSEGFFLLADRYQVELIGGDTTRANSLIVTTQVNGLVPIGKALYRHNAHPGDLIYVTGTLGDAGYALKMLKQYSSQKELKPNLPSSLLNRLNRPEPRVREGLALRPLAHAAIDISDGLLSDLHHILKASHCGAVIYTHQLPLSTTLKAACSPSEAIEYALNSGDDYELCFTAPAKHHQELLNLPFPISAIGEIIAEPDLRIYDAKGNFVNIPASGYQHFK